eukprot:TRINITY_DN120280_c0_g1_i1.p2 TRINITY_DN120280_c0_g1~~TRINITY_DN120280_c0_g1_i1.p2  ORF type:complete len:215 (+),score=11.79 TRINITY_DN120280_c0_g1_i1:335-979(+)
MPNFPNATKMLVIAALSEVSFNKIMDAPATANVKEKGYLIPQAPIAIPLQKTDITSTSPFNAAFAQTFPLYLWIFMDIPQKTYPQLKYKNMHINSRQNVVLSANICIISLQLVANLSDSAPELHSTKLSGKTLPFTLAMYLRFSVASSIQFLLSKNFGGSTNLVLTMKKSAHQAHIKPHIVRQEMPVHMRRATIISPIANPTLMKVPWNLTFSE